MTQQKSPTGIFFCTFLLEESLWFWFDIELIWFQIKLFLDLIQIAFYNSTDCMCFLIFLLVLIFNQGGIEKWLLINHHQIQYFALQVPPDFLIFRVSPGLVQNKKQV